MKLWSVVLAMALVLVSVEADAARRLGGGKSVGQQSSNVTQREATRAPGAPGTPAQATAPAAPAPVAAPSAAPKRPWGAMLGGLAAGLGLAWLAHSLGLGEGFGQFLMIALMVMVGMAVIGALLRARQNSSRQTGLNQGLAMQGAGVGSGGVPVDVAMPRTYNPGNVGNDASARPWERSTTAFESSRFGVDPSTGGSMIGSALRGSQSWGVPADFDSAGFLAAAKSNFVSLQSAWDRSDIPSLRAMMTDTMLAEIQVQLAERETHRGGVQPNTTDVMMLDAQLLGIEDLGQDYMASVEFSGMIREEPSAGPSAFREVWNMTKPKAGGGWLVAGVQALQ